MSHDLKKPKTIRYSGDLELRLSFNDTPLDRPSNSLHYNLNNDFNQIQSKFSTYTVPEPVLELKHGYSNSQILNLPPRTYNSNKRKETHFENMEVAQLSPWFLQIRYILYSLLGLFAITSFSLQLAAKPSFLTVQDSKYIFPTITASNFFIVTSFLALSLSFSMIIMFAINSRSTKFAAALYPFLCSPHRFLALADISLHLLASLFWFCTLIDVSSKSSVCFSTRYDLMVQGCSLNNGSLVFGLLAFVFGCIISVFKVREFRTRFTES